MHDETLGGALRRKTVTKTVKQRANIHGSPSKWSKLLNVIVGLSAGLVGKLASSLINGKVRAVLPKSPKETLLKKMRMGRESSRKRTNVIKSYTWQVRVQCCSYCHNFMNCQPSSLRRLQINWRKIAIPCKESRKYDMGCHAQKWK